MKTWLFAAILLCGALSLTGENEDLDKVQWSKFPDGRISTPGLFWFSQNKPDLWRLPESSRTNIPVRVWERAVVPSGGRIQFLTDSSRLILRVRPLRQSSKPCYFDTYTNDVFAGGVRLKGTEETDLVLFENAARTKKVVTVYLPNNHPVKIAAIGMDRDAALEKAAPFNAKLPIVCYGSSVLQGTGAEHPSRTYPAILARKLNCDFVNLGFGGAGKAEPPVVELVNEIEALCYIFDLGKSYGDQSIEPYAQMLKAVRAKHPRTPIICITPIYSTKEANEPAYLDRSEALRALMREAASNQRSAGDNRIFVVEGLDLFNANDKDLFSDPLHPNDEGNERIANRLEPTLRRILQLPEAER